MQSDKGQGIKNPENEVENPAPCQRQIRERPALPKSPMTPKGNRGLTDQGRTIRKTQKLKVRRLSLAAGAAALIATHRAIRDASPMLVFDCAAQILLAVQSSLGRHANEIQQNVAMTGRASGAPAGKVSAS